jgi:hypothetical protein
MPGAILHPLAAIHPQPGFQQVGFDEGLYRNYVNALIQDGIGSYPDIVDGYIAVQRKLSGSILPPIRFLYIFSAYLWHLLFGSEPLFALHDVASFFSMLTLSVAAIFATRLKDLSWGLGVSALMAVAPTQLHMSQHALIDGFFTFWALLTLGLLWENLRAPRNVTLLLLYTVTLSLLVLTKENSFFVFAAIVALLAANRWFKFGNVTKELLVCTFAGPLFGVVGLVFLAGGIDTLAILYQLSVSKNYTLRYAVLTGDGPWYRYLIDLMLVSPVILLLALGTIFRLNRSKAAECYLTIFVVASYAVMCNLKYGMNLRYANMWDMPLRFLALSFVIGLWSWLPRYRTVLVTLSVVAIVILEFRQFIILCVHYPLYELVPEGLLRALHILKTP